MYPLINTVPIRDPNSLIRDYLDLSHFEVAYLACGLRTAEYTSPE